MAIPTVPKPRQVAIPISSRPRDNAGKVHLGLGLTIVRAIADFHQATVNASNRRDPEGVTMTVAFPLLSRS